MSNQNAIAEFTHSNYTLAIRCWLFWFKSPVVSDSKKPVCDRRMDKNHAEHRQIAGIIEIKRGGGRAGKKSGRIGRERDRWKARLRIEQANFVHPFSVSQQYSLVHIIKKKSCRR